MPSLVWRNTGECKGNAGECKGNAKKGLMNINGTYTYLYRYLYQNEVYL